MEEVYVKRQNGFLKVLKVLLIVAAIGIVVVKIYQKFFKNRSVAMLNDVEEFDEADLLDDVDEADVAADEAVTDEAVADEPVADEIPFEVLADDVIVNIADII